MSQGDGFDFRKLLNVDGDPGLTREAIYEEFEQINARLSPMIWALVWDEMLKAKGNPLVLNAVLNSVVAATSVFVAASIDDPSFLDEIVEKAGMNIRNCYEQREEARSIFAEAAQGQGRALLLERTVPGMREAISHTGTGLETLTKMMLQLATMVQDLKDRGDAS